MNNRNLLLLIVGAVALIAVTAGASAYVTRDVMTPDKPEIVAAAPIPVAHKEKINWNKQEPAHPVQQVQKCDDGNIVGAGIGAVGGGLLGHQFGKGKGRDLATIGGVIAGGTAGHEYIPTRGTLCR